MALTNTTISAAIGASDLTFNVTSTSSFSLGKVLQLEQEFLGPITAINGTAVSVQRRGINGSAAVAHNILAPLSLFGLNTDFMTIAPGNLVEIPPTTDTLTTYGADGAITLPNKDTTIFITKATAAALTLADPTVTMNGIKVLVQAQTAAAHTVSNSAGSGYNGSGASADIATYGGGIGDSMYIVADNGKWNTVVLKNVTLG